MGLVFAPTKTSIALLSVAVTALGLIILMHVLSGYPPFKDQYFFQLFGIEGRNWFVGGREAVHFFGFIGCMLFGWSYLYSMTFKGMLKFHFFIIPIVLGFMLVLAKVVDLGVFPYFFVVSALIAVVVSVSMVFWMRSPKRSAKYPNMIIWVVPTLGCLSVSWGCEFFWEPALRACGWKQSEGITWSQLVGADSPCVWAHLRFQWAQIIIDLAAIVVGLLIALVIYKCLANQKR
ncbi:hypothetical protein ACLBW8_27365 [Pseudomonas sp. M5A4_2d]